MRETGNDGDIIWNVFYICWTERWLGLLKFKYGFAQNLAQDSPKQAKNEIIQEIASFQLAPLFIVRFASLVVKLRDWTENRESHDKIMRLERSAAVQG